MGDQPLVLHLGSNLGDPEAYLTKALEYLESEFDRPVKISRIYRTRAWGVSDQPDFLNMAAVYRTNLLPSEILNIVKSIETRLGRRPGERWHAREIDIDIIFLGNTTVKEKGLEIPHPRMHERRFVLQPLAEIIPEYEHPVFHKTVSELLIECRDMLEVKLWKRD